MRYILIIFFISFPTPAIAAIRQMCVDKQCITVELAQTPQALTAGLMGRDRLVDGHGMLLFLTILISIPFG